MTGSKLTVLNTLSFIPHIKSVLWIIILFFFKRVLLLPSLFYLQLQYIINILQESNMNNNYYCFYTQVHVACQLEKDLLKHVRETRNH